MRIQLGYGLQQLELDIPDDCSVLPAVDHLSAALEDPVAAVREALEAPRNFPALRQALTPDDSIAIVVDEQLPQPARLLVPIIEHVLSAHVPLERITLVCAPSAGNQDWIEDLPDAFADIHMETHAPHDRKQLSYLAMMKNGRKLYLNRAVVDAEQAIVLCRRSYHPLLGYAGGACALFPELSDEAARQEFLDADKVVVGKDKRVRQEAQEAVWLLGAPFFVQLVEGLGDSIAAVVAGLINTSTEAEQLQDARWSVPTREPVHTAVAGVSGSPALHDFATLARAAKVAARFVEPGGRIILLTESAPVLGEAVELLRQADAAEDGLELLRKHQPAHRAAALAWAHAAQHARIYLLSGLPADTVEELYATPLENPRQVQRLLQSEPSCLVLRDAHKVGS